MECALFSTFEVHKEELGKKVANGSLIMVIEDGLPLQNPVVQNKQFLGRDRIIIIPSEDHTSSTGEKCDAFSQNRR